MSQSAEAIECTADGLAVRLADGRRLAAQMVVLGVGVRPENRLAVEAGLAVGPGGGIRVNEHLQTDDPDVYAVGDAIEVRDFVTGQPGQVPLAGPANRQGRLAADHVFGRCTALPGNARHGHHSRLQVYGGGHRRLGEETPPGRPGVSQGVRASHAARRLFPGAEGMCLKLLFDPEGGRILGAQAVGGDGVDKRIDVLAVAIQAGMTVFDLEEMELAYAPQYGSAKDPVNMAGFVAAGLLRGDHPQWDVQSLAAKPDPAAQDGRPLLVDVRMPSEFAAGHIPGAVNVPLDELRRRLDQLPADRELAVYCQVGQRGYWPRGSSVRPGGGPPTWAAATRPIASSIRKCRLPREYGGR